MLHPSSFHVLRLGLDPASGHPVEEIILSWFDEQRLRRCQVWLVIFLCQLLLFSTHI